MATLDQIVQTVAIVVFLLLSGSTSAADLTMRLVDSESKAICDAAVYVGPQKGSERWRQPQRKAEVRIALRDGQIWPRIAVAQTGDRLTLDSRDKNTSHNLYVEFLNNPAWGGLIPAGAPFTRELTDSEPGAMSVKCGVHNSELGYLFVLDHNFIGISDKTGKLQIKGLPRDCDIPLKVFHEHGKVVSLVVHGERKQLEKGQLIVQLTDEVTDLGDVLMDAESFIKPEGIKKVNSQHEKTVKE